MKNSRDLVDKLTEVVFDPGSKFSKLDLRHFFMSGTIFEILELVADRALSRVNLERLCGDGTMSGFLVMLRRRLCIFSVVLWKHKARQQPMPF